ncbi:uncharacterized protein E0L32_003234 [Thyridium curvatum]|uniref:Ubiquitin-like domain-containing protein n=1 Tax=Thyridium curvatum TaxID=1093900 RepID=A0A507BCY1_9PEZI|nr:uncharacterized protein E0L32_003234 [Thyridium curvatum]TPX17116.1 hypothetical protein E0L32_003234 [Thyridium curvatum]
MSGGSSGGPGASSPTKPRPSTRSPTLHPTPRAAAAAQDRRRSPRAPSPLPPPLLLTVRFSSSLPDLLLDIPYPKRTTVAALKHLIRGRLAEPNSQRRLRFIHGGRILPDASVLSAVLRAPPPPPPSSPLPGGGGGGRGDRDAAAADPSGKGKLVEGKELAQRVYVNCSIGDSLTDEELRAEAEAAETPVPADEPSPAAAGGGGPAGLRRDNGGRPRATGLQVDTGVAGGGSGLQARRAANTTQAPRGFDRLLSTGFTTAEVNQLRLQFRSIQASRHTPDTMPSPDTLRSMEDAWIDNNNSGMGVTPGEGGEGVAGADGNVDEFGINGLLDVLLRGMLIGFIWPLGSVGWLVREEGLWSRKWSVFVTFGFVLSLVIGMIRAISGDV